MPAASAARGELVIATSNAGKQQEIREILADLSLQLSGLGDFPAIVFPEEGDDYTANAIAKAEVVARATGRPALADDSGLEVDGLGGAPGPRSARFGGAGLTDRERAAKLLEALLDCSGERRAARFVCVAALAVPGRAVVSARGVCPGRILAAPRGVDGFGYDPIFEIEPGIAMAELTPARKNACSHRARALEALRDELVALVQG